MGSFRRVGGAIEVLLDGRCLIGRTKISHWIHRDSLVSAEHAVVAHGEHGWTLRDLSSTNGTWLNDRPVREEVELHVGAIVAFGRVENRWEFVDDAPPHAILIEEPGGEVLRTCADFLAVPSCDQVEANLYRGDEGWIVESHGTVQIARDGMKIQLSCGTYTLSLPKGVPDAGMATVALAETERELRATFLVSPDEEHVQLRLDYRGRTVLFEHRGHSYLLLTLARKRLLDEGLSTCPPSEAGWYETRTLAAQLRTSAEQLNLWVWRARKQVQELDPDLAALIVERRPTLATLRLGTPFVEIERLN